MALGETAALGTKATLWAATERGDESGDGYTRKGLAATILLAAAALPFGWPQKPSDLWQPWTKAAEAEISAQTPVYVDFTAKWCLTCQTNKGIAYTDEVKRVKALEAENARLKKMLVDRDLEIEVMKEINAKKW